AAHGCSEGRSVDAVLAHVAAFTLCCGRPTKRALIALICRNILWLLAGSIRLRLETEYVPAKQGIGTVGEDEHRWFVKVAARGSTLGMFRLWPIRSRAIRRHVRVCVSFT